MNDGASDAPLKQRRGLPRHGDAKSSATEPPVTGEGVPGRAEEAPSGAPVATGRRSGLPRIGGIAEAPQSEAPPPQDAAAPRRAGLARSAAEDAAPARANARGGLARPTPASVAEQGEERRAPGHERAAEDPTSRLRRPLLYGRLRIAAIATGLAAVSFVVVLLARAVSGLEPVASFLRTYNGTAALPAGAPVGIPVWLEWQHFLNGFFLILIIRTGWQVRTQRRPPATWTRTNTGLLRTKNPPKKISLTLWTHLSLDVLWLVNGAVFVVLLFSTGQWLRLVPTSWEIVPNALAAALRYASFNWPTEDGWTNYNALQTLAYFSTVFLAAPLAAITGARMSPAWPANAKRLNRAYPVEWARAVHFPVMLYFVLFVIVHVVLVLATGALRNLNHMYGASDTTSLIGAAVFAGSVLVMAAAVWAARPLVLAPIASLMGRVGG